MKEAAGQDPGADALRRAEVLAQWGRLRSLLERDAPRAENLSRIEQFAARFAREFEGAPEPAKAPDSDFDVTVPAALEALSEMRQVDRVIEQLGRRGRLPDASEADPLGYGSGPEPGVDPRHGEGPSLAEVLGREVVGLMLENLAGDAAIAEPVRRRIGGLEQPLLRLTRVDSRFFSDAQHPGRLLLMEVANRGRAFESVDAPGFALFLQQLDAVLLSLADDASPGSDTFARLLGGLQADPGVAHVAGQPGELPPSPTDTSPTKVLAQRIAAAIMVHAHAAGVPAVVLDFLCGPWSEVLACARLREGPQSPAAVQYKALISALLWSAHPELARQDLPRLTRLLPQLLATLRAGLATIAYPVTESSAFLVSLTAIHQQAFQPAEAPAPADLPDQTDPPDLPALGAWFERKVGERWEQSQLTWVNPQGSLFMFASATGATRSMTRKSYDALRAAGQLRTVAGPAATGWSTVDAKA